MLKDETDAAANFADATREFTCLLDVMPSTVITPDSGRR